MDYCVSKVKKNTVRFIKCDDSYMFEIYVGTEKNAEMLVNAIEVMKPM